MNLIVTESAQIQIECMGSFGVGKVNGGTITLSGPFTGSCTLNPTYSENMTIDGDRVLLKISFTLSGAISGFSPSTSARGSIQGSTGYIKDDNRSLVTSNAKANIINGSCIQSGSGTTMTFTGTASFIDAGQLKTYGD